MKTRLPLSVAPANEASTLWLVSVGPVDSSVVVVPPDRS